MNFVRTGAGAHRGFHARMRAATRPCHEEVDGLFGRFDLADPASYGAFLTAHAMALVPVEDWADIGRLVPGWAARPARASPPC